MSKLLVEGNERPGPWLASAHWPTKADVVGPRQPARLCWADMSGRPAELPAESFLALPATSQGEWRNFGPKTKGRNFAGFLHRN